jgi:DNA repair exonuclease SbcCD ATPase subunit
LLHELSVLKNNLLQKERDILILENSLSTGNFIAETIKNNIAQHEELIAKKIKLTDIREGIRQIGPILTEYLTSRISLEASTSLSRMLLQQAEVEFNSAYEIKVTINGTELLFGQLSEGQKVMTALSIRLSLVKITSNLGIVILDEPSINLDEVSRQLLAEVLSEDNYFSQMIIISHDNTFEGLINNTVTLSLKNGVTVTE